ncbi:hypothetical protein, conserved [Plasmodium gonderi]|uniref:Uncharacterized protein n=1 Tax=Plasmodium gonderi TaxID=77519 RepID=A0A1Y1JHY7_PLAGO|nr:hypothetical protein, conserved [Plasmodium gonderi]GAW79704.1 hypothetical protein, conserved [Plasmodium gonderi]
MNFVYSFFVHLCLLLLNQYQIIYAYKINPLQRNNQHKRIFFTFHKKDKHRSFFTRNNSQQKGFNKTGLFNEMPDNAEVELLDEIKEHKIETPNFMNKSGENNPIKDNLKKTKKFCNYLTSKLGRLHKKLREIKKLETIFCTNPNILTESQQVKLSKKKQIKNEIVLINRYRKKYIAYKKNLSKNVDDLSPFFYSKKKTRQKRQVCTTEEFNKLAKSDNPTAVVQRIKNIDYEKIPKNVTDYLVFNKVATKEEVKILIGLKAVKINGNILDDENYVINPREDEVKVFNDVIKIHESHYVVRKRFTKKQKKILEEKTNEQLSKVKEEIKQFEKFFNIKQ